MHTRLIVTLACLLGVLSAQAALISYEPFNYAPTGGVNNLDGGSGWLAPWTEAAQVYCEIVSPGLQYADSSGTNILAQGNAWRGSWNAWAYPERQPDTNAYSYLLTNGVIGARGTTNWFSFLTKFSGVTAVTIGHFGVVCRYPSENFGERVWMGARPSGSGVMETDFTAGAFGAPYTNYPGAVLVPDVTYLLVTRVVYGTPTPSNDYISLWTNPLVGIEPNDADANHMVWDDSYVQGAGTHPRIWDTLALAANATASGQSNCWFYVDEFRFGETGKDVVPLPEPCGAAALALAIAAVVRARGSGFR
jgi:hypothetical protein